MASVNAEPAALAITKRRELLRCHELGQSRRLEKWPDIDLAAAQYRIRVAKLLDSNKIRTTLDLHCVDSQKFGKSPGRPKG
ncbi:MAG: hypothetical protein KGL35_13360 [Bradyrhizobium sp.]|nr:hypothetical protein [Bradyrhizobium sp.]